MGPLAVSLALGCRCFLSSPRRRYGTGREEEEGDGEEEEGSVQVVGDCNFIGLQVRVGMRGRKEYDKSGGTGRCKSKL